MTEDDDLDVLWSSRIGDIDTLRLILSNDPAKILSRDENGNTVLHMASANGHLNLLELIMSYDESSSLVNSQNSQGNTPLHWAVLNKKTDVVSALIKYGAKLCVENEFNETPIDVAVKLDDIATLSIFEKESVDNSLNDSGDA